MSAGASSAGSSRGRSAGAGVVGALAVAAILLASVAATLHAVVLSPSALGAAVAPVGANPQVRAAVAGQAAAEVVSALDVEGRAAGLIGGPLGSVTAPAIARAVQAELASAIDDALASPAFAEHWRQMVDAAADGAVAVLEGDSSAITTSHGVVYLNLLPAVAGTLDALKAHGLLDASVRLPDLSSPATPARQALASLSSALGLDLPPDFGQVAIAQTAALEQAQAAVAAIEAATLALDLAALGLTLAAVVIAVDRPATLIRIGLGAAFAMALVPPLLRLAEGAISASLAAPGMSVVAAAITDAIVGAVSWPLRAVAGACLAVAAAGMAALLWTAAGRRRTAALPVLAGALAALAWLAIGPDPALLATAVLLTGLWIARFRLLGSAPA